MKPSNQKKTHQSIAVSQQKFYSGPIPDAESLQKYEEVCPGFAERLMRMAEKEQEERITIQKEVISVEKYLNIKELNNYRRGQVFALISVILVISLCCLFLYNGYAKEAKEVAITVIASLAGVFIIGRFIKPQNNN